jgi:hypothetical protein
MDIEQIIKCEVKKIIELFVNKDYIALKESYLAADRDIDDFISALNEYWQFWDHEGFVTMAPDEEFENIEIIERANPSKAVREFSVTFDFWIEEERSDLTLDCDVEYHGGENIDIYLYDLHVL